MNYEGMIYRPPSEAYSLILQVTVGCANNTCTFCSMYKDKKFHVKSMASIEADLAEAARYYGNRPIRIFLADGDALVLPIEKLKKILALCQQYFPKCERITTYATAKDVVQKTPQDLADLRKMGLSMVYMGLESGSEAVLEHVEKHVALSDYIKAAKRLRDAGIQNSVTLISGLGGQALLEEHALASAKMITAMKPDYLGFLTLILESGAPMLAEVTSGRLQLLTPPQVLDEMTLFLTHVDSEGTVFRANHASNYLMLAGTLNQDIPKLLNQIEASREQAAFRPESFRGL